MIPKLHIRSGEEYHGLMWPVYAYMMKNYNSTNYFSEHKFESICLFNADGYAMCT